MKKICLLAIASFFSAFAFSQNAATTQTVPGQPKVHATTAQATTPTVTNASGTQPVAAASLVQPVQSTQSKSKFATIKSAQTVPVGKAKFGVAKPAAVAADKAANKVQD